MKDNKITAYVLNNTYISLEPASSHRQWMDKTNEKFAYKCLPLAIANSMGWVMRSPIGFTATYSEGNLPNSISIQLDEDSKSEHYQNYVHSHFGEAVLTFQIPYLFKTSPNIQLLVTGPTNEFKDGITPLSGLVETDWASFTFTMNWKFTRENHSVRFNRGDVICTIIPTNLNDMLSIIPEMEFIEEDADFKKLYEHWGTERTAVLKKLKEGIRTPFQRDYALGRHITGEPSETHHFKKIRMPPFSPPKDVAKGNKVLLK